MLMRMLLAAAALAVSVGRAQTNPQVELANLREDVRGLVQKVGQLSLKVEQLERENAELRERAKDNGPAYATLAQLNDAIVELRRAINSGDATISERSAEQIRKLANETNAAIDSLAKGMATRPVVQTSFSDSYSKEGVSYTVQKGDTLALIAKKTGAKSQDIINANKIADPSRIQAGQTLFIPVSPAK